MRSFVPLALLVTVGLTVAHAQIHFTATLNGAQENPPVSTTATGTGSFTLSSDLSKLAWSVTYQGLSGTLTAGGHFHAADSGRNGPIVKNIAFSGDPASNTISGTWSRTDASQPLTTALVESLLAGRLYVNFHTTTNPGGEMRGQVLLSTGVQFTADLSGLQQNPPVTVAGHGTGAFVLNPQRSELRWYITYRDLTSPLTAGGHFHVADSGRNGPIVKAIALSGDSASKTFSGVWTTSDASQPLTRALVDSLFARKVYVNFHTTANPAGEIRGQLVLQGGTGFVAQLNGAQQNPPVTAVGSGTGSFALNDTRTELKYDITYIKLSGTLTAGGHFHVADSGRNGPIVRAIGNTGDPASNTLSGVWRSSDGQALTPALAESVLTGRTYVNFHTNTNPGGEIRGQVQLSTGIGFTARLDGSQENPPVTTAGKATASVVMSPRRDTVRYNVTYQGLSGNASLSHFHVARQGVNGPVVKNIFTTPQPPSGTVGGLWTTSDATQTLTRALADSMIAGKTYINFHTAANPGGEMRGQVQFGSSFITEVRQQSDVVPAGFTLEQNYPNPFNPSTKIRFDVVRGSHITLKVYDILGREVQTLVNQSVSPGTYSVEFHAEKFASGVYIYRLVTDAGFIETRKMILLR